MLSAFPSLFTWGLISPLIIRLTLGAVFIYHSLKEFKKTSSSSTIKSISIIEIIAGILIILGLWTQIGALFIVIDLLVRLIMKIRNKTFFTDGVNYYFLLLIMAISLLFTGAGFFAFDLPL